MKKLILLVMVFASFIIVKAEEEGAKKGPWVVKGQTGLTYSNAWFGKYWAAGGDASQSLLWQGLISANHTGEKGTWENTLDLTYGLLKQGTQDVRKMNDKIDFLSKYSINGFNDKWRYMVLLNLKSQFTEGFKYESSTKQILVSDFMAPAYVTASLGIEYLGSDKLKIFISPFAEKTTLIKEAYYNKLVENYVTNTIRGGDFQEELPITEAERQQAETALTSSTTYGLAWRENSKTEIGALAQVIYDHPDMVKGFGLKTRLDLFAAYANIDKVDIDWEIWLTFKFNQYLSMNINTQMIYDDDIKFQENFTNADNTPNVRNVPKIQFRNLFGVGLVYTFSN